MHETLLFKHSRYDVFSSKSRRRLSLPSNPSTVFFKLLKFFSDSLILFSCKPVFLTLSSTVVLCDSNKDILFSVFFKRSSNLLADSS